MPKASLKMSDKERILLELCRDLASTIACHMPHNQISDWWTSVLHRQAKVGDLVACVTCKVHPFLIGWVVEAGNHEAVLREIGSDRTCRVENESFRVIGINQDLPVYYEGERRALYEKVQKAYKDEAWTSYDDFRPPIMELLPSGQVRLTFTQRYTDKKFTAVIESVPKRVTNKKFAELMRSAFESRQEVV